MLHLIFYSLAFSWLGVAWNCSALINLKVHFSAFVGLMTGALRSLDLTAFGCVVLIEIALFTVLICFVYPYSVNFLGPELLGVSCWIERAHYELWHVSIIKLKYLYIFDLATFSFLAVSVYPLLNCNHDSVTRAFCLDFAILKYDCHPEQQSCGLEVHQGLQLCCLSLIA